MWPLRSTFLIRGQTTQEAETAAIQSANIKRDFAQTCSLEAHAKALQSLASLGFNSSSVSVRGAVTAYSRSATFLTESQSAKRARQSAVEES